MKKQQKKRRNYYAPNRCPNQFHVSAGTQGGTRAYASATIDGCFAVRGIKLVEGGKDGLFVSMPSRKTQDGYKEICFPVTAEFRNQLYGAVMDAYHQALELAQAPPQASPVQQAEAPRNGQQMAGM